MNKVRVTCVVPVENEQNVKELIEKCVVATLEAEQWQMPSFIDITITDNEEIREINKEYREKDSATDVLSFPMYECYNGEPEEDLDGEEDPETGLLMLGDMIISYERACEQAKEFGHSVERECGFLTVHSVLHLLGYDHERNEEEDKIMRDRQKDILTSIGLER